MLLSLPDVTAIPDRSPPLAALLPSSDDRIAFLHSSYGFPKNVLFCLSRIDCDRTSVRYSVHHRTALTACQIMANNACTGYLAFDAKGEQRMDQTLEMNGILLDRRYYFILEGEGIPYLLRSLFSYS